MKRDGLLLMSAATMGIAVFIGIFLVAPTLRAPVTSLPTANLPTANDAQEPRTQTSSSARLTFVGDIMLARNVEQAIANNGIDYPFAGLGTLFAESDVVVGNFEGTVREKENIESVDKMAFDTIPANVAIVANAGFTDMSLANNHADDFGDETTALTRETLIADGITPFGDPFASENFIDRKNVNGIPLSIIGFHAFAEETAPIFEAIKKEEAGGRFVIVFAHWGVEYRATPYVSQVTAAHDFADAGADLIIGAHPHVIETVETYNGVPIVYSLGNFLFDQDFSTETMQGLVADVIIDEENVTLRFSTVSIKNRQTTPMSVDEGVTVLATHGIPDELTVPRIIRQ